MRYRVLLVLAALAVGLTTVPSALAADDVGDFQLEWGSIRKANRPAADALRKSGAMEAVVAEVNRRYALPRDVPIGFTDELQEGPAFVPVQKGVETAFIIFPGTFLTDEVRALRHELKGVKGLTATQAMIYANQFVLAHEIGHALVNQLDLPITGKEEDAVDGFAAYLLAGDKRFGARTAVSAALFFDAIATDGSKLTAEDFADEHSILQQRIYQFLCWTYGSDPKRYRSLVGDGLLPRSRAALCGGEWKQVNRSWSALLAPYANSAAAG